MPSSVAWAEDAGGNWDISFTKGQLSLEDDLTSIVKHTILCKGRLSSILQIIRSKREGSLSDLINQNPSFSVAWYYYSQGQNTNQTRLNIRDEIYTSLIQNPRIAQTLQNGGNINIEVNLISLDEIKILVTINQTIIIINV